MRISAFNRSCERKQSHIYPSKSLKKAAISFDHDPILFSTANPEDEVFGRHNADLFRRSFPDVHFVPEPNIVFADDTGRIVTAGGATSWHDLAIHIISRHCGPGEALHIAKLYLLQWHGDGQLPFASLVRRQPHADSVVRQAEDWLRKHYRESNAVAGVVEQCGIPERSLKRRFSAATGSTVIGYVQNLRIEEAKRLLESGDTSSDNIAAAVGYENPAFFRKLFKRCTGLTAGHYRRMFRPISDAGRAHGDNAVGQNRRVSN
jgi:transcriptional regulator GlxA family with amidase domain